MKHLYKYPQSRFPYDELARVNRERSIDDLEYEILDTGVFDNNKYFDVFTKYAKADEEDILVKITVVNKSEESAEITMLPTLWFTNLWSFGLMDERPSLKLSKQKSTYAEVKATHPK